MRFYITFLLLCCSLLNSFGQHNALSDSLRNAYNAEMKLAGNHFSENYYPNRTTIYSLNEAQFLKKMDSLQQPFIRITDKYAVAFKPIDKDFISKEQKDLSFFFDRMLLDYPYFHENHTGKKVELSTSVQLKLNAHLNDFNTPELLASKDFQGYVEAFLRHRTSIELKKPKYKTSDNKRLDAYLNVIPVYFTNTVCRDFWAYHYLYNHLDNWGSKHVDKAIQSFLATCKNEGYAKTIDSLYTESRNAYKGHVITSYKTVDGFDLDLHIFLPDSSYGKTKRPVMVYFSGGSWTEGSPEWDFYNCENYARKGWVAVSVEYRVADRYETTPFEAVKDARSAIRWLRLHAETYAIDTSRIVASGNSAGGHLVLTTALAHAVNESTDDVKVSASPNLLLVNAGVYNLMGDSGTDWIRKGLKDKNMVKLISPQHLLKKGMPPVLIVHGTNDQSVAYSSAEAFVKEMNTLGNTVTFKPLEGAPHYIWFDRRFSGTVSGFRKAFLKQYGYE